MGQVGEYLKVVQGTLQQDDLHEGISLTLHCAMPDFYVLLYSRANCEKRLDIVKQVTISDGFGRSALAFIIFSKLLRLDSRFDLSVAPSSVAGRSLLGAGIDGSSLRGTRSQVTRDSHNGPGTAAIRQGTLS
jgi:hypothetical protein